MTADSLDAWPLASVNMSVTNVPLEGLFIAVFHTINGIDSLSLQPLAVGQAQLGIRFKRASVVGPGTYEDSITVRLCHDRDCARIAAGPTTITTTYTVEPPYDDPEAQISSRTLLFHDVIDAEISHSLGAIVMVSGDPRRALYIYDLATGQEHELPLNQFPASLALSPDGTAAAIGHYGQITYVDLTTVGQAGSPTVKLLNVSADVADLVLANGYVYAVPRYDQWEEIHSIEIASNIETLSAFPLYAGSVAKMVPSGDYLYTVDRGLSPEDIEKWDLRSGVATYVGNSPYHGDHPLCGDLWISEEGDRIFTACGNTFWSSEDPALDMRYAGKMELPTLPNGGNRRIVSLSHSAERKEMVLVDAVRYPWGRTCDSTNAFDADCISRLHFYESDFLGLTASYVLPPVTIGSERFPQRGLFVFHSADGSSIYLISRLEGLAKPADGYYLSVLQ